MSEVPFDIGAHRFLAFLRGCRKHCAVCNSGGLFTRWFTMAERCPRCDLRFERSEGHWTGDLGINTIVSFGTLLIALIVGFLVSWPDPPGIGLFLTAIGIAGLVPLAFFPFSKTIWLAIDLIFRPLEPGEVAPGYGPQRGDRDGRPLT
jgi:uncharacterized protein (DUF983 family)